MNWESRPQREEMTRSRVVTSRFLIHLLVTGVRVLSNFGERSGVTMDVDLYVLLTQRHDVMLGIQWLQNLGKVTHDYGQQTMKFTLFNTTYSLKGDDALRMKKIRLHQMQALLGQDEIYMVYEVHSLPLEAVAAETQAEGAALERTELATLLGRVLFVSDKVLFPRPCCWLKKDGSYQFCVDYRALIAITVQDKFPTPMADEMLDELGGAVILFQVAGVEMDPKKVKSVLEWPEPMNQRQEASAFDNLKQQLSTSPILRLPDFIQMFVVEADTCDNGIGA
ncbi:retrotransposon-related protein, partial [Tanacetum coccineum]